MQDGRLLVFLILDHLEKEARKWEIEALAAKTRVSKAEQVYNNAKKALRAAKEARRPQNEVKALVDTYMDKELYLSIITDESDFIDAAVNELIQTISNLRSFAVME